MGSREGRADPPGHMPSGGTAVSTLCGALSVLGGFLAWKPDRRGGISSGRPTFGAGRWLNAFSWRAVGSLCSCRRSPSRPDFSSWLRPRGPAEACFLPFTPWPAVALTSRGGCGCRGCRHGSFLLPSSSVSPYGGRGTDLAP